MPKFFSHLYAQIIAQCWLERVTWDFIHPLAGENPNFCYHFYDHQPVNGQRENTCLAMCINVSRPKEVAKGIWVKHTEAQTTVIWGWTKVGFKAEG